MATVETSATTVGAAAGELVRELRRSHFNPRENRETGAGFRPALLAAALGAAAGERLPSRYPLFLAPAEAEEGLYPLALGDLLRRAVPAGAAAEKLREHLGELETELRRLATGSAPLEARALLEAAGKKLAQSLGAEIAAPVEAMLATLPAASRWLPWSEHAWLHLLAHAGVAGTRSGRAVLREEVRAGLAEAKALEGPTHVVESEGLGALGSRFLDEGSLHRVLERQTPAPGAAGGGLRAELAVLEGFLTEPEPPPLWLVAERGCELPEPAGWQATAADDPFAAATELFDREAGKLCKVLRALRKVRLELAGEYQPARHDPWLEQLDWQAFSHQELRLLAPVVVVVGADHAASGGMVGLSRLLLSGRPVQVVILVDPALQPGAAGDAEPLAGYRFEPGFLALAHREALVNQTTLREPAHLMHGFVRALATGRSALHVIAAAGGENAEVRAVAEVESRAHPLFHYDPEQSSHWAERLDLERNPQPEADWPIHDFETEGHKRVPLAFTFADLALLQPAYAHHFRPLPDGAAASELLPIAEWASAERVDGAALPFLWAVDDAGRLRRLAVSRPLALACRDRLDFWRMLQELAGVRNEPARRAAEAAREEARAAAAAEREQLVAAHALEIERLHRRAAEEMAERLTTALLDVDVAELVAPIEPAAVPARLGGSSVDEVAALLLGLVDPATLDQVGPGPGDGRAGQVASELLRWVGEV